WLATPAPSSRSRVLPRRTTGLQNGTRSSALVRKSKLVPRTCATARPQLAKADTAFLHSGRMASIEGPPKLLDDLPQIVRVLLDSSSYFGCARRFGFLRRFFTRVRLLIGRVHNRTV